MKNRQTLLDTLFVSVASLGALFVLVEAVFQLFGASLCTTAGCKVIAASARFGEASILLIGLAAFSFLAVLSVMSRRTGHPGIERLIDLIMIVALASEGFFAGYQAFRAQAPCLICLTVLGFMVGLGLLRYLMGRKDVIAGFASMAAVFSLFYLILPAQSVAPLPREEQLVLFYSTDCKYCDQVMTLIEEKGLRVEHLPVSGYAGFLKGMGIEHVPTLYVNNQYRKMFLTGRDEIMRYLFPSGEGPAGGGPALPGGTLYPAIPLFPGPTEGAFPFIPPAPDPGICKQDEECD